jgi:hypothetical protein
LAWQYLIEITRRDAPRWVQAINTTRPARKPTVSHRLTIIETIVEPGGA